MKFYRILCNDDIVKKNKLEWVPWSFANVKLPPEFVKQEVMRNDEKENKLVFFFPETNKEGFEEIQRILKFNDVPFVTKEVECGNPNIFWGDDTQVVIEITAEEWKREREIIDSFTIPKDSIWYNNVWYYWFVTFRLNGHEFEPEYLVNGSDYKNLSHVKSALHLAQEHVKEHGHPWDFFK